MSEKFDVIIIGGGPAGLSAGLYSKRAALKTILFEKGLIGGQIAVSKEVDNYPGIQSITGFDLAEKMVNHVHSFGLEIVQQEVSSVTTGEDLHTVSLINGNNIQTVSLILAMGASVKKLGIPGEKEYFGSGVSYCATCDGYFFRDKTVVVVGGGDSAIEEALHLSRITAKVYVVNRSNTLRAGRAFRDRLLDESKIEVIWNTIITEIRGDGKAVNSVEFRNTNTGQTGTLHTEGVFIRIGYYPNNALIPSGVRINDLGFIITDEKNETAVPGIFAAGDLRQKFANQIIVAAADGCIAALGAAHYVELHRTARA